MTFELRIANDEEIAEFEHMKYFTSIQQLAIYVEKLLKEGIPKNG